MFLHLLLNVLKRLEAEFPMFDTRVLVYALLAGDLLGFTSFFRLKSSPGHLTLKETIYAFYFLHKAFSLIFLV